MKEITVAELKAMKDNNEVFQLIDVREQHEYDAVQIGGILIPMGNVMDEQEKINRDKKVIIHCRSGARSAAIISALEKQFGFDNLYNLKGGIKAYSIEIDNTLIVN